MNDSLVPPHRLREDELEWQARDRVARSPRLRQYASVIFDDAWADDIDHLRWVLRGRIREIAVWASKITEEFDG
jgi:hypothetical protein